MFLFVFCVVPLSRFRRLSGVGVVLAALVRDWSSRMVSEGFQTQKSGSWNPGKERAEKYWQVRSRLMGERSWFVNSAESRMCGRGGVAGDVIITARRCCTGSVGRRLEQSQESGLRGLRRRAGRKTES